MVSGQREGHVQAGAGKPEITCFGRTPASDFDSVASVSPHAFLRNQVTRGTVSAPSMWAGGWQVGLAYQQPAGSWVLRSSQLT